MCQLVPAVLAQAASGQDLALVTLVPSWSGQGSLLLYLNFTHAVASSARVSCTARGRPVSLTKEQVYSKHVTFPAPCLCWVWTWQVEKLVRTLASRRLVCKPGLYEARALSKAATNGQMPLCP